MIMKAYAQKYNQNAIETASPEQILIMLYDGAIRFVRQAIAASEQNDQTAKLGRIAKVFAIIVEFSNTLNHDIGGEIAADLDGLYQFMLRELDKARNETDEKCLHVVEGLLVDLRTTWGKAILKNKAETKQQVENSQMSTQKSIAVAG